MKIIKYLWYSVMFSLCIGNLSTIYAEAVPQQPSLLETIKPGTTPDQLSPEQLAQLEKEYKSWEAQAQKEVDAYVKTLSPEEKAQFQKDVQDLTEQMSKMSPEELVQFIETMVPETAPQYPMEETKTAPMEFAEMPVVQEKEEKREAPIKDIQALLTIINDIIMHTERFLRTTQMIPELPGNIAQWASQRMLHEWGMDQTWEKVKARIESFNQKLHLMKEKDPKNGTYRYLSAVLKDETLYNNLVQLQTTLSMYEPKVQAPSFGLGKVTDDSRRAIKMVLNNFAEAIYKLAIPDALDKVMGTYEPRAKELREAEETSRKKAFEESKKQRMEAPKREIGTAGARGDYTSGGYGSNTGGGYGGYTGYTPSTGGYSPYEADYGSPQSPTHKPSGGSTPSAEGKKPGSKEAEDKAKKEADDKMKKEQEQKKPGEAPKLDASLQRLRDKIGSNLDAVDELIADSALASIQKHMTNAAQPVDMQLAADTLPKVGRKFKTILDQVKEFKQGLQKKNLIEVGMKELKSLNDEHKKLFESLVKQIDAIKDGKGSTPDKTYAYLDGMNKNSASANVVAAIPVPASLIELMDLMKTFEREVAQFAYAQDQKKAAAQAPAQQAGNMPSAPQVQPQAPQPQAQQGQPAQKRAKAQAAAQAGQMASQHGVAQGQIPVVSQPALQQQSKRSAAAQQAQPQMPAPSAPPAAPQGLDDIIKALRDNSPAALAGLDTTIDQVEQAADVQALNGLYLELAQLHNAVPDDLKQLFVPRIKRIEAILAGLQPEGR